MYSIDSQSKVTKLGSFSWSDCGSKSEVLQVQSIQLSPDPIIIPGNISLALQASISLQENTPVPVSPLFSSLPNFARRLCCSFNG